MAEHCEKCGYRTGSRKDRYCNDCKKSVIAALRDEHRDEYVAPQTGVRERKDRKLINLSPATNEDDYTDDSFPKE
jgi:hypothetical protein